MTKIDEVKRFIEGQSEDEIIRLACQTLEAAAEHATRISGVEAVGSAAWWVFVSLNYKRLGPERMEHWFNHMAETIKKYGYDEQFKPN